MESLFGSNCAIFISASLIQRVILYRKDLYPQEQKNGPKESKSMIFIPFPGRGGGGGREALYSERYLSFVIHWPYTPYTAVRYYENISKGTQVME